MNQSLEEEPDVLGAEIIRVLADAAPSADDIRLLQDQLLARHSLLAHLKPVVSSEEVVEGFFRCFIVDYIQRRYELGTGSLATCINSSHRAVQGVCTLPGTHSHNSVTDDAWQDGWRRLRKRHSAVDIKVPGHHSPRRADLYIVTRENVVSLEFKYIGPNGLRDPASCAAQIRLHADNHRLALLLLYCGASIELANDAVARLESSIPANARVFGVHGPEIPVARRAA